MAANMRVIVFMGQYVGQTYKATFLLKMREWDGSNSVLGAFYDFDVLMDRLRETYEEED